MKFIIPSHSVYGLTCQMSHSHWLVNHHAIPVAYLGIFFGRGSTNSVEDRENGFLRGSSPTVRGSGGSCNLVQEISFHMVTFS